MSSRARALIDMGGVFIPYEPGLEDCWRGILLYGRNSATYKFALARALLDLKPTAGQLVKLDALAVPYAQHICDHLVLAPTQGTSSRSRLVDACRQANRGELDREQLLDHTVRFGFNNVIDAFHIVGSDEVPHRFFVDERERSGGIRITDAFSGLMTGKQVANLAVETESRWRLVETAWTLGMSPALLKVQHDTDLGDLFVEDDLRRRRSITGARGALSGYQKGHCFYCFEPFSLRGATPPEVDHFFPHSLKAAEWGGIVDGIWNLVLACRLCNRGKSSRVPSLDMLARLHTRNEYLIGSKHPLRETLMAQTGADETTRVGFLNRSYARARARRIHVWHSTERGSQHRRFRG